MTSTPRCVSSLSCGDNTGFLGLPLGQESYKQGASGGGEPRQDEDLEPLAESAPQREMCLGMDALMSPLWACDEGGQAAHMTWLHGECFVPPVGRENRSAGKRVSAGMPIGPGEGALLALSPHSFLGISVYGERRWCFRGCRRKSLWAPGSQNGRPYLQAWGARSAAPQALSKLGPWGDRKTGPGGQRANRDKP